jgi:uncharacterized membrane protein
MKTPAKRPAFESPGGLVRPVGYDPNMPRPAAISAGAGIVMLRVLAGFGWLAALAFNWGDVAHGVEIALGDDVKLTDDTKTIALALILGVGGVATLLEGVLAVLIYRGHNWARVLVMLYAVVSISGAFVTWWVGGEDIRVETTLVTLSLDILVLLALSSRQAAAYARRKQQR